jgi:plastocyanin domain-containing protein
MACATGGVLKMKSVTALALSIVLLGVIAGYGQTTNKEDQVQRVKLTVADNRYVLAPAKVTKGVPVNMEVDLQTVKGCARTVVIAALGVKKTVKKDDATIVFTPDKSGIIAIVCGMDMVKGSLTVIEP